MLPLGLFRLMRPYLQKIDNIKLIERVLYSKELTVAGQVDCVCDYDGKLSVIDFKSSNRWKKEEYVENYFLQTTGYATMYEELVKKKVEQIVILIAGEDGSMTEWIKDPADYKGPLIKAIKDSANTGEIGDGKIFSFSVEKAIRIRTGDKGTKAI